MLIFSNILQVLVLGQPGEEVSLELILRVVADVGLVVSLAYSFSFCACLYHGFLMFMCFPGDAVSIWSNDTQSLMIIVYDKRSMKELCSVLTKNRQYMTQTGKLAQHYLSNQIDLCPTWSWFSDTVCLVLINLTQFSFSLMLWPTFYAIQMSNQSMFLGWWISIRFFEPTDNARFI